MLRYLCMLVALSVSLNSPVGAQERHALVVGIDTYENIPMLQKAGNDARAVSATLEEAGFEVTTLIDGNRRELNRALSRFAAGLAPGDEALFYFAGHGVEVQGRNYLLPADVPGMRPGEELFLINESIAADDVLGAIQASGARVSVMILDACRDNPFPQSGTRSLGRSRGLARLEAPAGTFIMFSAGIGQAALDRLSDEDPNPNSVFTRALLPLLAEPGLPIHEVARRLRREVEDMAESVGHVQRPAYYDEVTGEFVIQTAAAPVVPASAPQPQVEDTPPSNAMAPASACETALAMWQVIESTQSVSVLNRFFETFRDDCPVLAELAAARMASLDTGQLSPEAPPPTAETNAILEAPIVSAEDDAALFEANEATGPCTVFGPTVVGLLRGTLTQTRVTSLLNDHPDCGAFTAVTRAMQGQLSRVPSARRMADLRIEGSAESEAALNLSRESRMDVQRMLSNLGFESGQPDGVFGPTTRRALADFLILAGALAPSAASEARPDAFLSAQTLALLRRAQDIAPRSIDGTWVIELNRFGDEAWLRANDPELLEMELVDLALERIEVVIENGDLVSYVLEPVARRNPILEGTIHSLRLDGAGRLQIDVTSHFLGGNRRENRRLDIDITLRPGHLSSIQRREVIGRYDDAFLAVIHVTRFIPEQVFE